MGRRKKTIRSRRETVATMTAASSQLPPPAGLFAGRDGTTLVLGVALVLIVIAYANALNGGFVYDDETQILQNPLIQQPHLLGRALVSDVWAFSGQAGESWSNYWRPLFVAWMSASYAAFGADPAPWHAANIVLHFFATALGLLLLNSLGLRPVVCAATTWLFAVIPIHVESVTWISGASDPLLACWLFAACLCHLTARSRRGWQWHSAALFAYAAALLTKETAVVFPAIVFAIEWALADKRGRAFGAALRGAFPYVLVVTAYLALRIPLVGVQGVSAPGAASYAATLSSAPELLWFYVRHTLLPFGLGPSYPLQPITFAALTWTNFALPLAAMAVLACGAFVLSRRDRRYCIHFAWFLFPLLPVFDVHAFIPDDIAHDRYLYLPAFGALALVVSFAADGSARLSRRAGGQRSIGYAAALAVALALVPSTWSYNRAWANDVSLWERGVQSNPANEFPHAQLGDAYRRAGRLGDARHELELALTLNPDITAAHVALAAVARQQGHLDEAERHLGIVLARFPDLGNALQLLGMVYQAQGRLDASIAVYEHARKVSPYQHGIYTVNLAVLQRLAGRNNQAREELESLGADLGGTRDPKVMRAWWYLGELDREAGRNAEAAALYEKYLAATSAITDADVMSLRSVVLKQLQSLRSTAQK